VKASASDVEVVTRRDARFLYVIAVRRGAATSRIAFSGLPPRNNGAALAGGHVLWEYVQDPLPPPIVVGSQQFRPIEAGGGSFRDWLGPHDARAYRFEL
jgi:hypothetical protein